MAEDRPCKDLLLLEEKVKSGEVLFSEKINNFDARSKRVEDSVEKLTEDIQELKESVGTISTNIKVIMERLNQLCDDKNILNGRIREVELVQAQSTASFKTKKGNKDIFMSVLAIVISVLTALSMLLSGKFFGAK